MSRNESPSGAILIAAVRAAIVGLFGAFFGAVLGAFIVRVLAGRMECHLGFFWGGLAGLLIGILFHAPISAMVSRWCHWPPRP
jgi:hypothetical protein